MNSDAPMTNTPTPETTRPPLQPWQLLALLLVWVAVVAVCFGVPVVALLLAGDALDWRYNTAPMGLLGGAAAGLLLGTGCTLLAGRWLWMRLGLHRAPAQEPVRKDDWHHQTPATYDASTEPKKSGADDNAAGTTPAAKKSDANNTADDKAADQGDAAGGDNSDAGGSGGAE